MKSLMDGQSTKLGNFGPIVYNNSLSIPFLLIFTFIFGENKNIENM